MKNTINTLDSRVTIHFLSLSDCAYTWESVKTVWAGVEQTLKSTYLSSIGVGARSAQITFRAESAPTMQQALEWQGKMYYPTAIVQNDRAAYVTVTAAQVEPTMATLTAYKRTVDYTSFPAVLLEKYLRYAQERPMGVLSESYVLIVPKPVALEVADLVLVPDLGKFEVQVPHRLDPNWNQYEIVRKAERNGP
jgi:hypothetical protein